MDERNESALPLISENRNSEILIPTCALSPRFIAFEYLNNKVNLNILRKQKPEKGKTGSKQATYYISKDAKLYIDQLERDNDFTMLVNAFSGIKPPEDAIVLHPHVRVFATHLASMSPERRISVGENNDLFPPLTEIIQAAVDRVIQTIKKV